MTSTAMARRTVIEQYRMMSLSIGNSWSYENKQTNDKFDQQWPFAAADAPRRSRWHQEGGLPGIHRPAKPATITVDMWGGTLCSPEPLHQRFFPVPISVNADPVTDRASWIEPPYGPSPEPGSFAPLTPARVLDTRSNQGANGPVPANGVIDVQLTGQGGIPATGVSAVAINVTAVSPSAPGFISAWPSGSAQPNTSILNFTAGQTTPNMVVLPVGTDGKIKLFNGSPGTVQLLGDVTGYFVGGTPTAPGSLAPLTPARVLDTRIEPGREWTGTRERRHRRAIDRTGRRTCHRGLGRRDQRDRRVAVGSRVDQRLAIGSPQPNSSILNFTAGQNAPNMVVLPVGPTAKSSCSTDHPEPCNSSATSPATSSAGHQPHQDLSTR